MKDLLVTYVLPVLLWGAVSGLINLAFTNKSRIDTWAEANPRLAAVLKILRAIGLDPWHLLAAASLFAKKRLPAAQRSGALALPLVPIAQQREEAERRKRSFIPPPPSGVAVLLIAAALGLSQESCSSNPPPKCSRQSLGELEAYCVARIREECAREDTSCDVYQDCSRRIQQWRSCQETE